MLRFVVAGMAVVILALAGVTGFLAYENLSEDDGGGTTRGQPTAPTGWEAVSYEDKHGICHEFATTLLSEGRAMTGQDKYQTCMKCGPQKTKYKSPVYESTGENWWERKVVVEEDWYCSW